MISTTSALINYCLNEHSSLTAIDKFQDKTKLSAMLMLRLLPHSCSLRMCNFFRFQTSCHETRKRKETELEMLTGTIEGWEEEVI